MQKKTVLGMVALGVLSVFIGTQVWAQPGMGRGRGPGPGGGMGGPAGRMYDPQTATTVSGQVVSMEKGAVGQRGTPEVRFILKTDQETLPVILGPGWHIDKQAFPLNPQDTVEVKGSRVTLEGQPAIIAAEVKKGDQTLKLRDANGVPVWAGQGRR